MGRSPATLGGWILVFAALVAVMAMRDGIPILPTGPVRADADAGIRLDDDARARGFEFAPGVPAEVGEWFGSALARAQPHARRLIDAVDGQVTVQVHPSDGMTAGFVQPHDTGFVLSLDVQGLRTYGAEIRDHVLMHELGHVVDFALVTTDLRTRLDLSVPRIGGCTGEYDDAGCASVEERFADTFAKWALNDPVVLSGAFSVGYRVAPPANLALWGEPLEDLPT